MDIVIDKLNEVVEKLNILLNRYEKLKVENLSLQEEKTELKEKIDKQNITLKNLEEKVKTLQIAKGEMDQGEKQSLKLKINEYIREIDRCIALLNN
jgi:cell division protein FtsL